MSKQFIKDGVRKDLLYFAIPAFLSCIFTELYNITNSFIVGNYVSLEALSAVSASTWICNIFNYTFYGLGMGAGIIVAKYYGAKDKVNLKKSLDSSIVFAVIGGIGLTLLSESLLPLMMKLCNIGPDIYNDALGYLRVYLLGNTFVLTSQMCFFILRSFGDTKHQLYYSIISSFVNIILGVILVRIFHLDVIGTAIATIVSQLTMDILALRLLFNYDEDIRFDFTNIDFSLDVVKEICRLGIPAGIQNMLIAISSVLVQSYVNLFPNEVIAGVGVAEKVGAWAQMSSVAVSAGTMAMVSQNMGAKDYKRAREVIKESMFLGTIFTLVSMAIIFVLAEFIVSRFNDNELVIKYGTEALRYSLISYFFLNWSHVYNGACRGAGNVKIPMLIAIAGQVVAKYLFVYVGLKINFDVHVLYLGTAFGYSIAGILAAIYFNTSKWTKENHLRV